MKITNEMMQEFLTYVTKNSVSYIHPMPYYLAEYTTSPEWRFKYPKFLNDKKQEGKKHLYLLTFTFDRKKPGFKRGDEDYYNTVRDYIDSLAFSTQYKCSMWKSVREYHSGESSDVAHYHIMVEFDKTYDSAWFKYYSKKYGNVHKSWSVSGSEEFLLKYLSKDFLPKQII